MPLAMMSRDPRRLRLRRLSACLVSALLCAGWVALPVRAAPAAGSEAYGPSYQQQLNQAQALANAGKYKEAARAFKTADKMQGGKSVESLLGMAEAYNALHKYHDALKSCDRALKLSPSPKALVVLHNLKGMVLYEKAGNSKKTLRKAEVEFQAVLQLVPNAPQPHWSLGIVLLAEGRDQEGANELRKFLSLNKDPKQAALARRYIAHPGLARETIAPQFAFTSLRGRQVSLSALEGKVVLIDFWASWCEPCRDALPALQQLYKKYEQESRLVIISVSADKDRGTWKSFVEKKHMAWTQYFDGDGALSKLFGVNALPTYILIDPQGGIRAHLIGEGGGQSAEIRNLVKKSLRDAAPASGE